MSGAIKMFGAARLSRVLHLEFSGEVAATFTRHSWAPPLGGHEENALAGAADLAQRGACARSGKGVHAERQGNDCLSVQTILC